MARTAEKPFDFTRAAEEHAAQDETEAALWHRLPVGQRQRAAPGAAEQKPLPDSQVFAQALQILNQMLGRVARDFTDRRRGAGTALVVQHDPEKIRVEEAAVFGRAAAARTAVQEHDRNAPGVSADLPVHRVDVVERPLPSVSRHLARCHTGARDADRAPQCEVFGEGVRDAAQSFRGTAFSRCRLLPVPQPSISLRACRLPCPRRYLLARSGKRRHEPVVRRPVARRRRRQHAPLHPL